MLLTHKCACTTIHLCSSCDELLACVGELWQRKEKNDSSNCEGKNMFKWTDDEAELLMCDYKVLKAAEGRLGIYTK